MTSIALHGAGGRMGAALVRAIAEAGAPLHLAAALECAQCPVLGQDSGQRSGLDPNAVPFTADVGRALARNNVQVLIDFSRPEGLLDSLAQCVDHGVAFVSGTTGLTDEHQGALERAAMRIPVLHAMNFSLGVAVLRRLAEQAAQMLGELADVELIEAHHRHKVDAPSGTALALGESVAAGLGQSLDQVAVWSREGQTGERPPGAVGFSVIRGGDIVGEHTALFAMDGERVELSHRATDRMIFARGAVRAARWLAAQPPGQYTVLDCLSAD